MVRKIFSTWTLLLAFSFLSHNPPSWTEEARAFSIDVPTQEELLIWREQPTGLNEHFTSLASNANHTIYAPLEDSWWNITGLDDSSFGRCNLDMNGRGGYDCLMVNHAGAWRNILIRETHDNSCVSFAGWSAITANEWLEGDRVISGFIPYNLSVYALDLYFSEIDVSFGAKNFSVICTLGFDFANLTEHWQPIFLTGTATAKWNDTLEAIEIVEPSLSYGRALFGVKVQPDNNLTLSTSWGVWYNLAAYQASIAPGTHALDNATHAATPRTSQVIVALCLNDTTTNNTNDYVFHATFFFAFADTSGEADVILDNARNLDIDLSYVDSNRYWYDRYTYESAVNLNDTRLNKLYYYSKHLSECGHVAKRFFAAGALYQFGMTNYAQDSFIGVRNALYAGLWDNVENYLETMLNASNCTIDLTGSWFDGFNNGVPYWTKNMFAWTVLPYEKTAVYSPTCRATVDFLASVTMYYAFTRRTEIIADNWETLTKAFEAVYAATKGNATLPLTNGVEDQDGSLMVNLNYYYALKGFATIAEATGNETYAHTLTSRYAALRSALNAEVGSGGLWHSLTGRFVNESSVSPTDASPYFQLWGNLLAINYDVVESERADSIFNATKTDLMTDWGYRDMNINWSVPDDIRIWNMKNTHAVEAMARVHDSSTLDKVIWSFVNNPYSGLNNETASGRYSKFNFPEYWTLGGSVHWVSQYQYAWCSSATNLAIGCLFGVQPTADSVRIYALKPSNIGKIQASLVPVGLAHWNITVMGSGNATTEIDIDGVPIAPNAIPSRYYRQNGTYWVQITLGTRIERALPSYMNEYVDLAIGLGGIFLTVFGLTWVVWKIRKSSPNCGKQRKTIENTKKEPN